MGKHLLWSLDIIQECIWKVWQNFGVHQPLHIPHFVLWKPVCLAPNPWWTLSTRAVCKPSFSSTPLPFISNMLWMAFRITQFASSALWRWWCQKSSTIEQEDLLLGAAFQSIDYGFLHGDLYSKSTHAACYRRRNERPTIFPETLWLLWGDVPQPQHTTLSWTIEKTRWLSCIR